MTTKGEAASWSVRRYRDCRSGYEYDYIVQTLRVTMSVANRASSVIFVTIGMYSKTET